MPRILTVDDSRAIRMIVSKQVLELGFEVEEAEDGNEGLKKLQAGTFDLVLLDVTMPNLDGPGMLMKMREANNRTPVVMLTSESKTSIVTALMKLGIGDYILKPFKADELRAKLLKALRLPADFAAAAKAPHAAAEAPAHGAPAPLPAQGASVSARGKVDILVIDDMENVHKKLRTMIPSTIAVDGCLNVVEGLALARVRAYKLILIDAEIPETNVASLAKQLRLLQPEARFLGLALRSANNLGKEMRELGLDGVLTKPFAPEELDEVIDQHFAGTQDLIVREENLIRMSAYHGKNDRIERHYTRLGAAIKDAVEQLGQACFDEAIVDATLLPVMQGAGTALFVAQLVEVCRTIGVAVHLVASNDVAAVLRNFQETKDLHCHGTLEDARALAA
jgi:DNA-binding response OmpR family regulator